MISLKPAELVKAIRPAYLEINRAFQAGREPAKTTVSLYLKLLHELRNHKPQIHFTTFVKYESHYKKVRGLIAKSGPKKDS